VLDSNTRTYGTRTISVPRPAKENGAPPRYILVEKRKIGIKPMDMVVLHVKVIDA